MKTSFKPRVSRMGLGSFVNINIFVMKYYFFRLFIFSIFSNLLNFVLGVCCVCVLCTMNIRCINDTLNVHMVMFNVNGSNLSEEAS